MEQGQKSKIIIIGGGPAGCICAYFLQDKYDVTLIDKASPLATLLPTGGGRCNLAHAEYDFKELVKNYPRGEKFLYSVFSQFSTVDTLEFFKSIGIDTYVQDDMRIFPKSNSSKDVREKLLNSLNKTKLIKEEVLKINRLSENEFCIITNLNSYKTNFIIIASGGHSSYEYIKQLGHKIIPPKPSLTGLQTKENFSNISGVSINGILFTHKGVSGPKIYEISSIKAREEFPYKLNFDFVGEINLQEKLNSNPHKSIKNLLSEYVPKSFADYLLTGLGISSDIKCHTIDGRKRDSILNKLRHFEVTIIGTVKDGEVVTSGGVDLKEVNPQTLESKLINNIYFCGEVLNIDGFCGGYNLQNCWSTGYAAAKGIMR